ncbi:MAG: hypothetical protein Q4B26_14785 [Eubacteriales bacterium]|nr:hypothetical protein [Eubacteriales bacterium]
MRGNSERAKKAQNIVLEETSMEFITDVIETPDFVEIKGECGGDMLCYRVYDDGSVYAK